MTNRLRIAFIGDSWFMDWLQDADSGEWVLSTPIADAAAKALALHLQGHCEMETTVVGFPGGTAENTLRLAKHSSIRDISRICKGGTSLKKAVANLPFEKGDEDFPAEVDERIDFAVIALGPNDLNHKHDPIEVANRLLGFREIYAQRNVEVAFVSVGGAGPGQKDAWPDFEASRLVTNTHLKEHAAGAVIVDCDELVANLPPELWVEGWHLTSQGYGIVGQRLGDALAPRCCELAKGSPKLLPEKDLVAVSGYVASKWEGCSQRRQAQEPY